MPQDTAGSGPGLLRVHPTNPRYLTDDGKRAVYLTGSHTWLNCQDGGPREPVTPFDNGAYLDILARHHHNFVRLWVWEGTAWVWSRPDDFKVLMPEIFVRTGPGNARDGRAKFDLTKFNQAFFDRVRQRAVEAGRRGIYVGVKFFEGFSVSSKQSKDAKVKIPSPWWSHPFHQDNNVNGVNGDPDGDDDGREIHTLQMPDVTRLQEAYVRKLIDTVNDLDNVIFEICNEGAGASTAWQYHFIQVVRDHERNKPKQHLVWMSYQWDGQDEGENQTLFDSSAEVIAPSAPPEWRKYKTNPPVASGAKVMLLDTDHIDPENRQKAHWVWMAFTRGNHTLFMDDPLENVMTGRPMKGAAETRLAMSVTSRLARRVNLAALRPTDDPEHCSTTFCLRDPGREYVVYQPCASEFTVELAEGSYEAEWIHPTEGRLLETSLFSVKDGKQEFTAPMLGPIVLYLHQSKRPAGGHAK
jgi:hypothetical protein